MRFSSACLCHPFVNCSRGFLSCCRAYTHYWLRSGFLIFWLIILIAMLELQGDQVLHGLPTPKALWDHLFQPRRWRPCLLTARRQTCESVGRQQPKWSVALGSYSCRWSVHSESTSRAAPMWIPAGSQTALSPFLPLPIVTRCTQVTFGGVGAHKIEIMQPDDGRDSSMTTLYAQIHARCLRSCSRLIRIPLFIPLSAQNLYLNSKTPRFILWLTCL